MAAKRKFNYKEVYLFAKEWGREDAVKQFGISDSLLRTILSIGDEILENKPPKKDAKTLDEYSPRELMQELARRGYRGKLVYEQLVDIRNL